MHKIIICVLLVINLSGCASTRALKSARSRIDELEQLNEAGSARNIELGELLEAERAGNRELGILLSGLREENDRYLESERNRIAAEKQIIESLSGIFSEGSDIIEELIRGYNIIREYFESQEIME